MRYLGVPTLAQETGTKGGCFVPGFHLVDACGQPRCYMLHVTTRRCVIILVNRTQVAGLVIKSYSRTVEHTLVETQPSAIT
jgi:hypothetical protein